MKRCHIFAGGDLGKIDRTWFSTHHGFIICADSGYKHAVNLGLEPDIIVGDFDSYTGRLPENTEIYRTVPEKDDTDTWFAVKEALRRGFTDFLLLGVVGQRLDHSLGNLSILLYLHQQGMQAQLLDDFSQMEIVGNTPVSVSADFSYFSLLNISGLAKEVTIKNAVYPLDKAEISCTYQYAISNQVLPGQVTEITVGQGSLLLIKVW